VGEFHIETSWFAKGVLSFLNRAHNPGSFSQVLGRSPALSFVLAISNLIQPDQRPPPGAINAARV
jgi:hypothetical protein